MDEGTKSKIQFYGMLLVFVIFGPFAAVTGGMELYKCFEASGWPTTEGRIGVSNLNSKQNYRLGRESTKSYDVKLRYSYKVDDKTYTGHRVTFGGLNRNSRSYAEEAMARYHDGAIVKVFYNATSPGESVLDTSTTFWSWLKLSLSVLMLFLAILMIRHVIRKKKGLDVYGEGGGEERQAFDQRASEQV